MKSMSPARQGLPNSRGGATGRGGMMPVNRVPQMVSRGGRGGRVLVQAGRGGPVRGRGMQPMRGGLVKQGAGMGMGGMRGRGAVQGRGGAMMKAGGMGMQGQMRGGMPRLRAPQNQQPVRYGHC